MDLIFMLWHEEIVIMLRQLYIKLCRPFVSKVVNKAIGTDENNAARPHIYACKHTANRSTTFSFRIHLLRTENTKTELFLILKHLSWQNPISIGSKHNNHTSTDMIMKCFFFSVALRPNAGHGLLILEVYRSHTTTHHSRQDSSKRVISSSHRSLPGNTQHSQQTNIHAPGGIRTHDLSRRAAAELRLRSRGHWDQR